MYKYGQGKNKLHLFTGIVWSWLGTNMFQLFSGGVRTYFKYFLEGKKRFHLQIFLMGTMKVWHTCRQTHRLSALYIYIYIYKFYGLLVIILFNLIYSFLFQYSWTIIRKIYSSKRRPNNLVTQISWSRIQRLGLILYLNVPVWKQTRKTEHGISSFLILAL